MKWQDRLDQLTALRGVAALLVVFHHARTEWHPIFASGERLSMLVASSWLWVHFFFVLSGFVMMHAYGEWFRAHLPARDYFRFIIIRFGRIYPLYAISLAACVVVVHTGLGYFRHDPGSLIASILLLQGFTYAKMQWNYVGWSISTEWYVYLLFPWIAFALARTVRLSRKWLWITVIAIMSAVGTSFAIDTGAPLWRLELCFFEFVLGCLVHVLVESRSVPRLPPLASLALVLAPLIAMSLPVRFDSVLLHGFIAIGFSIVLLIVANQDTPLERLLNGRALQFLGTVSYSVYLLHPLVYQLAQKLAEIVTGDRFFISGTRSPVALLLFVPYLVTLLFVSWLAWRFLEEPARRASKHAVGGRRHQPFDRSALRST